MKIRAFKQSDEGAVIELWTKCKLLRRPATEIKAVREICQRLQQSSGLFLVGVHNRTVIASVVADYDPIKHRGWLSHVATDPQYQRLGYASAMLVFAEKFLQNLGCVKISLRTRSSNHAARQCYCRLSYFDEEIIMSKRLKTF